MRRRVWTRLFPVGALVALACVSDQNPLPTQPSQLSTVAPYPACSTPFATLITSEINTLYPNTPNLRQSALSQFSSIVKQCSKNPADAQTKAVRLAGFAAKKFLGQQLVTGTPWDAVSSQIDHLYQYVGLPAPGIPAGAVGPNAAVAVVAPTDPPTVVETEGDNPAGVSVETGAFSSTQTVLVTITPDPAGTNPFPNPSGFQEVGPFYDFQTFPPLASFNKPVLVGICVDIADLPYDQAHRLQLAHAHELGEGTTLEILPRVDAGFLSCNSYVHAGSKAELAQAGRAAWMSRLAKRALALFRPEKLHAGTSLMPGGLGGLTGSFSDFRALDPGKLVFTQQPTNTPAGSSITPAPQVTVEREDGTTIAGDPGNITVAIGTNPSGGTLSGTTTVSTGATGVATFPGLSINNPGTGYTLFAQSDTTDAGAVPQPATSAAFDITSFTTLIDCGGDPGDLISRGFYVPGFPGTTLNRVTLHFSSNTAGSYTLSLTARAGTYDGTILGTSTATVTLTANSSAAVATTFTFPSPAVAEGSTVTFSIGLVSGPDVVFYSVAPTFAGDPTCPVFETNGTTPPLDTPRRQGVQIKIEGAAGLGGGGGLLGI